MSDPTVNNPSDVDINNPLFNEKGENTRKAVSGPTQALQIARRLQRDDWQRDFKRAQVLGAFNGEAPYSDSELQSLGQSYRYNVSFGYMEGVIGRGVVPYNDLTTNPDALASVDADLPDEKVAIIQQCFVEEVKQWGRWPKSITRLNQELVIDGFVNFIWPSNFHPWPMVARQSEFWVNEGTPNDVKDLELGVYWKKYMIHELYEKIEYPETAAEVGWNVDNVRKALMGAMPDDIWRRGTFDSGAWTAVEQAIRGGALFSSIVGAKLVETFHVFASEIDGSVTHYIVLNTVGGEPTTEDDGSGIELYKKERRFTSFSEFLVYFDLEAGDGKWHGSRGLGRRSYNTHVANDKLMNSILDQAFSSGLTILQPREQEEQEDFQLVVNGPFAVIPPGIDISANNIPAIPATTFQAAGLITNSGEQRTGDVVPQAPGVIAPDKTATQARIDAGRAAMIGKSNLQRYLDPLGQTLSIILRRLLIEGSPDKYAKRFQEKLMKRGITRDDINKIKGAKSTGRVDDVLGKTQQDTQILLAEFRGDPDIDQSELKRRRLASIVGPADVDSLLIKPDDDTLTIEAARAQKEEIGTMIVGIGVEASPRDNHEVHALTCIDWLSGQLNNASRGQPTAELTTIQMVMQHAAQHLGFLAQDKAKRQISKQIEKDLKTVSDGFNTLQQQAQKSAQQAQQQMTNATAAMQTAAQPGPVL